MNKCSICEKEIQAGATECSLACMNEASRKFIAGPAAKARSVFASAMRKMLEPKAKELVPQKEVSTIVVRHKSKKNKSQSVGSIVLGFDNYGIARVPDVGSNRVDVEAYCKHSKGLAEIVEDVASVAGTVATAMSKLDKQPCAALPEVVEEPAIEVVEDKQEVPFYVDPDDVADLKVKEEPVIEVEEKVKKPTGKKPVGKKS